MGDGTTSDRLVPTRVVGLAEVAHIASGGYHTCALSRDASVWCWGLNDFGQLGVTDPYRSAVPVRAAVP